MKTNIMDITKDVNKMVLSIESNRNSFSKEQYFFQISSDRSEKNDLIIIDRESQRNRYNIYKYYIEYDDADSKYTIEITYEKSLKDIVNNNKIKLLEWYGNRYMHIQTKGKMFDLNVGYYLSTLNDFIIGGEKSMLLYFRGVKALFYPAIFKMTDFMMIESRDEFYNDKKILDSFCVASHSPYYTQQHTLNNLSIVSINILHENLEEKFNLVRFDIELGG